MANLTSLEPFDCVGDPCSVGTRWQKWRRALNIYLDAANINEPEKQRATLLHLGGISLQEIFYNLPGDDTEIDIVGNVYTRAIEKLNDFFAPKQSKRYERHLFRKLKQEPGEKFEAFIIRLRHQASKCQFNEIDESIIDQILEKGSSNELRKKILASGDNMTLQDTIREANALETVERQMSVFTEKPSTSMSDDINHIKSRMSRRPRQQKCTRCGSSEDNRSHKCPALEVICHKCNFKGHFAKHCRSLRKRKVQKNPENPSGSFKRRGGRSKEEAAHISEVEYVFHVDGDECINCEIGGVNVEMLIDSGSKSNILTEATWEQLKKSKVSVENQQKSPNKILFGYGSQTPLKILGSFNAIIKIDKESKNATFYVIKEGTRNLLGKQTAISLGVLRIGLNVNNINNIEPFPKIKNVVINIPIDKSVQAVSQPYRRVPIPLEEKINKKIKELEASDIIEEVRGPSEWVSPMVPVLKANGDIRICIDMRKANTAIKRENYPLPTIDSLLPKFRKARYFSRLDIKNAFHQVEISEESRYITTFITSKGLYRYKRLLFGINAAPEIFQKIVEKMLLPCEGTVNFIDDILIYGCTEKEHDSRVKSTLNLLKDNNVLLNKEKCMFKIQEIRFLGHILSPSGIKPLDSYVGVITTFRKPSTVNEVHSFLGLVNFIGKWIPNLATLTEPLRRLLRLKLGKNTDIARHWNGEQDEAFNKLKESLLTIPTLGYYDPRDKTQVIADASPVGLGAVLIQSDKNGPRIIAYGNKSLTDCEKRYCQTEKEALALVWAVEHFKIYLYGKEFDLITDHKPLEVIFGVKSRPCARVERWVLRLQSFRYKVIYRPGKNNIADPLSRLCSTNCNEPNPFESHDYVQNIVEYSRPIAVSIKEIKECSETDNEILKIRDGFERNNWQDPIKYCQVFKEEFCMCDGILLRGTRIVIPEKLRQRVLEAAHEGHPGIVAMKGRLRTKVWWPKIDEHAEKIVKACKGCTLVSAPTAPHPMKRRQMPDGPWVDIAVDFMGPLPNGEYLLVVVDYFSRYKEIKIMRSITALNTINALKEIFSRLGYPSSITADNGAQFISKEIETFCHEQGIKLFHTIPYWPQMNGEVERQNRSILKRLKISQGLKKDWRQELLDYLVMYNSTPNTTTGKTPSELFFRRQFRDKIPSSLDTKNIFEEGTMDRDQLQKQKGKEREDRKRKATEDIGLKYMTEYIGKTSLKQTKPHRILMILHI
nr:unnamed protein product [Callosobruchus analis]